MGKIFCLMGKSSSGKDTIFKEIIKDDELALKPIVLYTTRPKREHEIEGVEYHFIDDNILNVYRKKGKIIEERQYNTINGIWHYCTIDDGNIDINNSNYLIIVTLDAYVNIKSYFGEDKVVPIYIEVEDGIRLERALDREKNQSKPNYDELCRRFLADNKDFSKQNLLEASINNIFFNRQLSDCIREVREEIIKNYK